MCDCSQDCIDYAKRSTVKYPDCVIKRRIRQKKAREKHKKNVISYLGGECVDCGMKAAVVDKVMEIGKARFAPMCGFDVEHTDWKKKKLNISYMNSYSWERTKRELDNGKCVLVCRVCHAIRTKKLNNENKEFREKSRLNKIKRWKNKHAESPKALNSTPA